MLISEYDKFVQRTDQSHGLPHQERYDIAVYGVAAEIGSVASAIKKRLLAYAGKSAWNVPDDEVIEELGDVIWYCFALARLANVGKPINIFAADITKLKREVGTPSERADRIQGVLDPTRRAAFLEAADHFPKTTREMEFEDYQELAFLTARTEDRVLAEVCLVVLHQLASELLRGALPPIEQELNTVVSSRPINDILGEMAWHVSALASLYGVKLSAVVEANVKKVSDRWDRTVRTPLHDTNAPEDEQFPRQFEVAFSTSAPGRSQMYLNGERLGDELTDNARDDDGYRFHDVMHLANVAKLGWSPVLRSLMKRKRKYDLKIDEVEDGARARIVEEAVIKAIHAEGVRLATLRRENTPVGPVRLFPNSGEITFGFLKSIRTLIADLEVSSNRYSEWEASILEGYEIFHRLRLCGEGVVAVDLTDRTLRFVPKVQGVANGSAPENAPGRSNPLSVRKN